MSRKEKENRPDPHRQIIPTLSGQPAEIFEWLEGLFNITPRDSKPGTPKREPDEMPERIVLCPVFGAGGLERGPDLCTKNWKPTTSPQPTKEQLVAIANDFYSEAKEYATVNRNDARCCIYAYNNLKGPAAYAHKFFTVSPGPKVYTEKDAPAADDHDTHKDRFIKEMSAHMRWKEAMLAESLSSVLQLQQETIKSNNRMIATLLSERREMMVAAEDALSKKTEREISQRWAEVKIGAVEKTLGSVLSLLPAVAAYATKGQVGIVQGIQKFHAELSEEARIKLFGRWSEGKCVESGVLDEQQIQLFAAIGEGKAEPTMISEFMSSLRPEQLEAAQSVLTVEQIQSLVSLAGAAASANKSNGQN